MGQDVKKIENQYDSIAKNIRKPSPVNMRRNRKTRKYSAGSHKEIGNRKPVWDFGWGPGQTTKYLKNLGIEISGLDLSEKFLEQARAIIRRFAFRKGNIVALEFEDDFIAGIVAFYAIVHFTEEQVRMLSGIFVY